MIARTTTRSAALICLRSVNQCDHRSNSCNYSSEADREGPSFPCGPPGSSTGKIISFFRRSVGQRAFQTSSHRFDFVRLDLYIYLNWYWTPTVRTEPASLGERLTAVTAKSWPRLFQRPAEREASYLVLTPIRLSPMHGSSFGSRGQRGTNFLCWRRGLDVLQCRGGCST